MRKTSILKRYASLDGIRGFMFLNMTAYHAVWDLVYIFGFQWQWFRSESAYVWQQWISWTFILLSGFCQPLGHRKLRRGLLVFLSGLLVTIVTTVTMKENLICFGILTFIGSCMLIMIPAERSLKKCRPSIGLLLSAVLFGITRNLNRGFLGFEKWNLIPLPRSWYRSLFTAYFGFPNPEFHSTDYFSLFPWIFLFLSGYFLYRCFIGKHLLDYLKPSRLKPLELMGQNSLGLYLLHQPVLYLVFSLLFTSGFQGDGPQSWLLPAG